MSEIRIGMMKSKIHRATVTKADLHYEGSITIDKKLMETAGILNHEQVDVLNITNGERFTTYAIPGTDGEIQINGAGPVGRRKPSRIGARQNLPAPNLERVGVSLGVGPRMVVLAVEAYRKRVRAAGYSKQDRILARFAIVLVRSRGGKSDSRCRCT